MRGGAAAIRKIFEGQSVDPDAIKVLDQALMLACKALGWFVGDDPATRLVAERVVECARGGERDPDRLKDAVLKTFRNGV